LLTLDQLEGVSLFARHAAEADAEFPRMSNRRRVHETIRRMIDAQVTDLLAESAQRIAAAGPAALADVHAAQPLIAFTEAMNAENRALKGFLRDHLYQHYQVLRMTAKARRIISDLFGAFVADPRLLPPQYQEMAAAESIARATADYIAGMTDRYSMKEYRRLFSVGEM
jgi:dGTPase